MIFGIAATSRCKNAKTTVLPAYDVQIESIRMSEICLGKSKDIKKQLEEFTMFKDSQDTRKACLAETAGLANSGKN